jgi:hypothetical protein
MEQDMKDTLNRLELLLQEILVELRQRNYEIEELGNAFSEQNVVVELKERTK